MRLCTFRRTRRATPSLALRSSRALLLEWLEDREVPSIADGTILVATSPSSFASQNQSSFPTGIFGVNPSTGAQSVVSTGGLFSLPTYFTEAPNQQLYISDLTAFGTGAIIGLDSNTGQQSLVARGQFINGPNALAFVNGFIYVADVADSSSTVHNIVRINPNTGQQTLITDGSHRIDGGTNTSFFTVPVGMVPAPGNNVYLVDEPGNFTGTDPGKLWLVNLDTGQQTVISSNNSSQGALFDHPVDVATDPSGSIIIANTGGPANNVAGSVFRINPQTGVQTLITTFGPYSGTDSVEVGPNGTIFVGAIANGNNPGQIIAVNPGTGVQSTLSSGIGLSLVEGIRVFNAKVQTAATTTSVTSSANPSVFGQLVTFTAAITASAPGGATPAGTVQFQIDGTNFGSPVSLSSGVATSASFSATSLAVGAHTVTASYSGDSSFSSSSSMLSGGQTINKASTTTAVGSSADPSVFGQSLTFTAIVTANAPGGGTLTGTVQFQIDGTNFGNPVSLSGGLATSTATSSLSVSGHTIQAIYSGDANFATSTATLAQTVNQASTTTKVTSSANPSMSVGSVTFTGTINVTAPGAGTATGTVQFQIDNTNAGSPVSVSTTSGVTTATFSTASLAVGTHTVTATYSGDASFATSTGTLAGGQVVNKPASATTTTAVSASANPSVFGQSVTFTATVSVSQGSGTPTGTVQFQIDNTSAASPINVSTSGGVTTATFSTATLAVGTHTVTATYSGDGNFATSYGSLSGGQTVGKAGTGTAVTSSVTPSVLGQSVIFTATISVTAPGAGTPTGTVQFQIDNTNAASPVSVSTSGGMTTASFSAAALAVGTHTVTATYSGDSSFASGTGTLSGGQTVNKAGTSTAVASSVNSSVSGQSLIFTATVSVTAPGAGTPTGTVQFQIDNTNVGSPVNVSTTGGVTTASFNTASVAVGAHTVTASYSGDGNFASSSGTLSGGQVVNNKPATATALSSSADPSVFGQSVNFTAIVSSPNPGTATPTGTVQFQIDSSNAGSPVSVNTSGGLTTASFSTASLAVGTHTVTASYSGDGSFAGSSGTLASGQLVNKASTSAAVTAPVNSTVFGQSVLFTATISVTAPGAGTPTGMVQFQIDGSSVGNPASVSTTGGVTTASFSTASLPVGMHTVTASYSGDDSFAGSTGSLSGGQTVGKASTSTALTSSVNPSVSGQSVLFTATISVTAPGASTPTGMVQFQIDGSSVGSPTSVSTTGGLTTASFSTGALAVGTHAVTATYSGDSSFATSNSTLASGQVVNKPAPATTTIAVTSSASPSVFGQSVTFTATVSGQNPGAGTPTGTVQFQIDSSNVGSPVSLSTSGGVTTASFSAPSLAVGTHIVTATYSGDGSFASSGGTLAGGQVVNKAGTSTAVASSLNPSVFGQSVIFTAAISVTTPGAGTPTGTVQFQIDNNNVGSPVSANTSGGLTTASFSTASLAVGSHTVTATYSGDGSFASSNGPLPGGQTINKASTSMAVIASVNPSVSGQAVIFTATISVTAPGAGTPTGAVQFQIDNNNVGSQVSVGTTSGVSSAFFSAASLAVGTHTITASYSGDGSFAASTGTLAGGQVVNNKPATTTALSSSANPLVSGQSVTFTAIVSMQNPGAGTPTGTVQFQIDNSNVGDPVSVSISGGRTTASFSTANLPVGMHTITASYSGDSSFASSTGALSGGQMVDKASTSTAVTSSVNPSVFGQSVIFTATMSVTAPGAGTPTGTVQFQIDNSNVGSPVSVNTTGGVTTASFSTNSLAVGSHTVTASYSGDGSLASSTGALSGGLTVGKASTSTAITSSVNPSVSGQSVGFTATVSVTAPGAGTPTGTIQFQIDSSNVGSPVSVSTSGGVTTASFSTVSLAVGTHTVTTTYSGDGSFASSSGSLASGQVVNKPAPATTMTAVSSSANPSEFGQNVTFTATVSVPSPSSGTPTGTVQFQIDSSNVGSPVSVSTSGGVTTATFNTASLAVGTHTVLASYSGDGSFAGSGGTLTGGQLVNKASTSTAVTSSVGPSVFGQSVSFTATINVIAPGTGTPTGTVQFQIDSSNAGSPVSISTFGGVTTASFSTTSLAVGSHTVTASYSGDGSFANASGTLAGGQLVNKASTSTTVTSSVNSSVFGQSVTFTATISVMAPGAVTPTGTVQFQIDTNNVGSPVSVSTTGGVTTASFSTTSLAVGTHIVTASYGGDGSFASSAGALSGEQTVGQSGTNTAVISSVNPSVFGQSVTFTATVAASAPGLGTASGTVQFQIDGSNLGNPVTLSGGVATSPATSALSVSGHNIKAVYSGDTNFTASTGTLIQTVNKASTSTAVDSSANPSVSGQSVTFTATISITAPGAGTPTGAVQFQIDNSNVGSPISISTTGGVTTAFFSTASLPLGAHTVTATYSGDGSFATSNGVLTGGQVVNKPAPATTTIAVSSSDNPSMFGQSLTFTATVGVQSQVSGTPTGTVQFQIDGSDVGSPVSVSTSGGLTTATFSTGSLAVGTHAVTATYSGDDSFASSGGILAGGQLVNQASTSTAVTSSVNPSVFGQSVTFTATISVTAPGAGTPTGTVQFQIDGSDVGSPVTLSDGQATSMATSSLSAGGHTVQALYSGDTNFTPSTDTLTQTVNQGGSVLLVSGFPSPSAAGASGDFTVTVQDDAGNTVTGYSGTIHFSSSDNLASLPADYSFTAEDNGTHTFSAVFETAGTQSLTAIDTTTASIAGTQSGIIIVPAAADHLLVTPSVSTIMAGTPFDVSVTVQDAYNNTVAGYSGTVTFSSADPYGTSLPADYTFTTDDSGVHTFAGGATLYTAGTWDVTATDTANPALSGSANVLVTPAAAAHFLITPSVATTVAGTPFDVTVTVLDAYSNTVTGYTGTVTFASADPYGASLPADYTFTTDDNGVHTFAGGATLYTAGIWDVTATDSGDSALTGSATLLVTPAAPDHFSVTLSLDTTVAGTPFDVTVTVQDAYHNTVTGYAGTVTFSSADPYSVTLPGDYTFAAADNGTHTFAAGATFYTAATWDVTVTDTVTGITGSSNVAVTAASAVGFQIATSAAVAASTPFDVTITALDAYGNVATSYQGTITFSTTDSDPGVLLPADYTFSSEDMGVHTFTAGVILVTPGDQVITVTDTNGLTGSATVTVITPEIPPGGGGGGAAAGRSSADKLRLAFPGAAVLSVDGRAEEAIDQLFAGGYKSESI